MTSSLLGLFGSTIHPEHANIYTIGEGLFTYMSLRPNNHIHLRLLSRHPIKHLQLLLLLGAKRERERESW